MGRGIATRAIAGGNEVYLFDQDEQLARALADELGQGASAGTEVTGDIVVLALPYEGIAPAIEQYGHGLAGKVVVDIVNPLDWESLDRVVTPPGSSSAEETAKRLPEGAKVVKAFNTTFAKTLVAGEAAGHQLEVLIAGDDSEAKSKVAALAEAGGMRPIDVGPLARARMLEQVGLFHIAIQQQIGAGFASALALYW
jgi:predicted dinucleotide-binding enzyme